VISLVLLLVFAQAQDLSPKFGVSFRPLGLSLGLELSTAKESFSNSATIVYDSTLDSHLVAQVIVRHDHTFSNNTWGLQLGSWEHDPHLLDNTETALGIQADAVITIQDLRFEGKLGLIHLQSYKAFQIDARASLGFYQEVFDPWGYRQQGYAFGVTGLHGATPQGGVLAGWADAWYTHPLGLISDQDVIEVALRVGYKPEEVIPPLRISSWGGVLSSGYRTSIPLSWDTGLFSLQRISLEPKLRVYVSDSLHVAMDMAIGLNLQRDEPSSILLNLGYNQGLWFKIGAITPL
jgi:hypothetical protein